MLMINELMNRLPRRMINDMTKVASTQQQYAKGFYELEYVGDSDLREGETKTGFYLVCMTHREHRVRYMSEIEHKKSYDKNKRIYRLVKNDIFNSLPEELQSLVEITSVRANREEEGEYELFMADERSPEFLYLRNNDKPEFIKHAISLSLYNNKMKTNISIQEK